MQPRVGVLGLGPLGEHVADIGGEAGHAQDTGLVFEQGAHLPAIAVGVREQLHRQGGVEVAAAGIHHEPLQRRVTHGVVH